MKITALNFNPPGAKNGLAEILSVVSETISELSESEIKQMKMFTTNVPYFDGEPAAATAEISERLANSDGIIIAAPAFLNVPSAMCLSFLEHLTKGINPLKGKNIMLLVVTNNGRYAGDILSSVLSELGAYDPVRIIIPPAKANSVSSDEAIKEIIEKQAEDYYRIVRQNRKYILPTAISERQQTPKQTQPLLQELTEEEFKSLTGRAPRPRTAAELMKSREIEHDSDEENIEELSRRFIEKLKKSGENSLLEDDYIVSPFSGAIDDSPTLSRTPPAPRVRTVKQMTLSLPHCFQPQLAAGLNAVFQVNITGAETFSCVVTVSSTECTVREGEITEKDVSVSADTKAWSDILKGKYTMQKAFMTGQLKIRGNFVLVTKFDQLFTLNMV
ncbi:MAG: SCP2 sterol-binding domain-containing protein [Clostridiales bacterium]|jgi:putative sterol carrier protein/NAD(P)H-dependent FMN reductase|nr:SCP2 sterol-binding domain-containing protein [Clostridiales bacterium]